jgi:hypothetical protein
MFKNEKGFSLVQVLISAAFLGGLSLAFMQLMSSMGQGQRLALSKSDEIELRSSIRMILDNENFCRVSLAGNGVLGTPLTPVVFNKKDIDEDTEGLDISLFFADQAGVTRSLKKYNADNNVGLEDKSKFGNLTIKSMKLLMNNGTGFDYNANISHHDIGVIRVLVEKSVSKTQKSQIIMNFDVKLALSTGQIPEAIDETRIISCSRAGTGVKPECITRENSTTTWTFASLLGGTASSSLYTTKVMVTCLPGEVMKMCTDDIFVAYDHDNSKVAPATWTYTANSCEGHVGMIEGGSSVTTGTYKVRGLCCNF